MVLKFLTDNKDIIGIAISILTTVGGGIWWLISRWRANKIRGEVTVFELIADHASLLPKLYATENDPSPLADHNIKYQPRDPQRDMQAELKSALNRSRYLLVTAPTGYGKTREAGMLAQSMMLEGWRVLRIRSGWLDMPSNALSAELGGNRSRVLIFLDDLNGLFSAGNLTQSPRRESETVLMLAQAPYHDRLLQVLDMFEAVCTASEIRVIATARSETEQWKLLEYSVNDRLWKRFERIELPAPADISIINLLEDITKTTDLKANESDFAAIAHRSDGTYRNILLNLRRWCAQNKEVNKDDFTQTLYGSWRDIYERAVVYRAATKYIYDAIDVLRQARIDLFPSIVEPTATLIWGGNFFQRFLHQREVARAMNYLSKDTTILRIINEKLAPSDGQIEARGYSVSRTPYLPFLIQLLLKRFDKKINTSLFGFAIVCYQEKQTEQAYQLAKKCIELDPSYALAHTLIGIFLSTFHRKAEAESAYRKSIELDPSNVYAYYGLGLLLSNLKRYEEAEPIFRKAIELDPSDVSAYNDLGSLLKDMNRNDEAETAYRKTIELDPSYVNAYNNLGILLSDLNRNDEAEAAYRKAIELDPSYAYAYHNLGILLKGQNRKDEAEAAYRKAIEHDSSNINAYYNLGSLLDDLNRQEEAETIYRRAIEIDPSYVNAYNGLGLILEDLNRNEEAEAAYRKAIEIDSSYRYAYYNLGNLLIDENQKRYSEAETAYRKAIELDPSYVKAYYHLGLLLKDQRRNIEAEVAFRRTIEFDPSDVYAYFHLGVLLIDLNRNTEAEAVFRKAIELDPSDANVYSGLGFLLKRLDRNEEAETAYRKAIELDPSDADNHFVLGLLLTNQKRSDEAETAYLKALELAPSRFDDFGGLDNFLNEIKRREEAEAACRKVIELDPLDASAYNGLGSLLSDLQRYREAEVSYHKAIELAPSDASPYNNLGVLLSDIQRYEEAETAYRKAIELDSLSFHAHYNLGLLLIDLNRNEEAEIFYRKSIKLNPLITASRKLGYRLGCFARDFLGNFTGKRRLHREKGDEAYIKQDSQVAHIYNKLGNLLSDLNRCEEAEAAFRKAIEFDPSNVDGYNNLGILLKDLKQYDEAEAAYRKVIELNPEDFDPYLGIVSIKKYLGENIPIEYLEKARQFVLEDDFYGRACLESVCDNFDLAFEYLQKASQKENFIPTRAWKDPDLQWIRDDPRFAEIVGARPEK
jgi:tetratricopeptide (TPR) repeat protein